MIDCIEETGKALNGNNKDIVKYLCGIEEERKHLEIIIQRQYKERRHVEAEIERFTYKLCLINKSLSMRIKAKNNYDKTIDEIKSHYERLVDSSNKLRQIVEKTQQELDDIMNKKTGTSSGPEGEEIRMLYVKSGGDSGTDDCSCDYTAEIPIKEKSVKPPSTSSLEQEVSHKPPEHTEFSLPPTKDLESNEDPITNDPPEGSKVDDYNNSEPTKWNNQIRESDQVVERKTSNSYRGARSISEYTSPITASKKSSATSDNGNRAKGPLVDRHAIEDDTDSTRFSNTEDMHANSEVIEKSKNLLLSRLRTSSSSNLNKPTKDDKAVPGCLSTIVSDTSKNLEEEDSNTEERRLSVEQQNKLLKRGIDDVLCAKTSKRSDTQPNNRL